MPFPCETFWRTRAALLGLSFLACDTAGFKDSYMALDAQGNRKRDVFYTDTESIYCVTEMASGVTDVTVVAKLRARAAYDQFTGRPHELGTLIGAEEQAPGIGEDLTVAFLIEKPEGVEFYPAGRLVCELYLDGKLERSLDFEVRYPKCPFEPVKADDPCAGLVLFDSECPSPDGLTCRCSSESGLWECG